MEKDSSCFPVPRSLVDRNSYSTSVADNITSGSVVYEVNFKQIVKDSCFENPIVNVFVANNVFDAEGSCQSIRVKTKSDIPSSIKEFNIAVTVAMYFNNKTIVVNDAVFITVTVDREASMLCVLIPYGIFEGDLIAKVPEEYLTPDYEPALDSREFQISKNGEIRSRIKIEAPQNNLVAYYIQQNIEAKSGTNANTKVIPLHVFFVRNSFRIAVEEDKSLNFKIFYFNLVNTNVSISSNDMPAYFKLDKDGLYIKEPLDFETGSKIMNFTLRFEITCADLSNLVATTTVTIEVLDVNDKPPVFLSTDNKVLDPGKGYAFSIFPRTLSNTIVGILKVRDVDTNSKITFKIDPQHQTYFKIDNVGIIETINSTYNIPFSNISDNNQYSGEYTMDVIASDGKHEIRTRVVVKLRHQSALNFALTFPAYVLEKSLFGSYVTFINMSGYSNFDFFSTQRLEFFLRVNNTNVYVLAEDSKDSTLTSDRIKVTIKVRFNDSNKHWPIFKKDIYRVSLDIEKDNTKDTDVAVVQATDDDGGRDGEILYSISDGNIRDIYGINASTGRIYLQYDTMGGISYDSVLTVIAQDKGVFPKQSNCSVHVKYIGVKAACIDARIAEAELETEKELGRKYLSVLALLALLLSVSILGVFSMIYKFKKLSANYKEKLSYKRRHKRKNYLDPRSSFSSEQTNPYYLLDRTKRLWPIYLPYGTSIDATYSSPYQYFTDVFA